MDFSWLGTLFKDFLHLFDPLKAIKHWRIWAELWKLYQRVKVWRDWYKNHIGKYIAQEEALRRQLYNEYFRPILAVIDKVRQITQIVAVVDQKLAAKLNSIFFRIEGYILEPLNAVTNRINQFSRIFQGFLTPLGFLDRATLLNSLWRDIASLRTMIFNPSLGITPNVPVSPAVTLEEQLSIARQYTQSDSGPIASTTDAMLLYTRSTIAQVGG